MVNDTFRQGRGRLRVVTGLVALYVLVVLATVVALAILSAVEPRLAPTSAWVHAVIVAVFAVVLPLRLRAVWRGSRRALWAVGIIAAALFLVNLVEAMIPNLFPVWMRAEMFAIAALMASVILLVVWEGVAGGPSRARV